jgi:hypothetical protein
MSVDLVLRCEEDRYIRTPCSQGADMVGGSLKQAETNELQCVDLV